MFELEHLAVKGYFIKDIVGLGITSSYSTIDYDNS